MTQEIKKIATATITPEGKTEIKIEGRITYKELAEKLQQQYENGALFEDITEAQKKEIIARFVEMKEMGDMFDLNYVALDYIKNTPWLGEKSFFHNWYSDYKKFERQLQTNESEYKDERQAIGVHREAIEIWKKTVKKSENEFDVILNKVIANEDVAWGYLEYIKMRAAYVDEFYETFGGKIDEVSEIVEHALAKKAIAHYDFFRSAKQPKLKFLDGMMFHFDKETETMKYELFFRVPYRRWVVTESATCDATIKIVK
ncbi:hypothetical protein [Bacillus nitratireducens]|uniref:hypothetical protein n=1 Tax=Bacillus nitratireducens TaxID=2026193 RepID=UPI00089D5788|nr:hypothetical protein [Bacillus nitratireducens]SEA91576.1 hypothetical protein SAMN04488146_104423 [Bacillus nitratireducens]